MRVRVVLVVALLALTAATAAAWPGRPAGPPPAAGSSAPPPAWIESQAKSRWLAYGTYCWRTMCVDMIAPESRKDLPVFTVSRGRVVRMHLGFAARSVSVSVGSRPVRAKLDAARRLVTWTASRGGVVSVFALGAGDASYHARLRLR